jgi:hypothetical protein
MNYLKLLENLETDLDLSNSNFETVKFFRKNIASVWLWYIVLISHYKKTKITTEIILSKIQKEHASRVTIFKIINYACKKKFFFKEKDKNDKRKIIISPTKKTIEEFEKWSLFFSRDFNLFQ